MAVCKLSIFELLYVMWEFKDYGVVRLAHGPWARSFWTSANLVDAVALHVSGGVLGLFSLLAPRGYLFVLVPG